MENVEMVLEDMQTLARNKEKGHPRRRETQAKER